MRSLYEKCFIDDESAWITSSLHISEQTVLDKAGNYREFEMRKAPLFKDNGERKGLVVIGRDITERRLSEHDLRIAAIAIEAQEGIMITDANKGLINQKNGLFHDTPVALGISDVQTKYRFQNWR
jgi:hypothetical protein